LPLGLSPKLVKGDEPTPEGSKDLNHSTQCCSSVSCAGCGVNGITRRTFLASAGSLAAGGLALGGLQPASMSGSTETLAPMSASLRLQPVLTYEIPKRKQTTSWRPWGGLLTDQDVSEEKERIGRELTALKAKTEFPLEILPLAAVKTASAAATVAQGNHDLVLMYAAGGGSDVL
jgi:hypothetical protein